MHVAFLTDQQVFRVTYRADGQAHVDEAAQAPSRATASKTPFVASPPLIAPLAPMRPASASRPSPPISQIEESPSCRAVNSPIAELPP